ncbi:MAG: isoamylase early set domain-containing protein [Spirochaetales bacterium]|nr:isoamylase early set domain-containing protein [Spirochaetales bacterium]
MDACNQIHNIIGQWKSSRGITKEDLIILDQHVRHCDFCADDFGLLRIIIENQTFDKLLDDDNLRSETSSYSSEPKVIKTKPASRSLLVPNVFGILYLLMAMAVFFGIAYPNIASQQRLYTFTVDNLPQARQVSLVGDFNGWDLESHSLEENQGIWKINIRLKPGSYAYNFVINGDEWKTDPSNLLTVDDGFGGQNSLLVVQ